jgi:PPOX class probable F420-dependent enzyme
VQLDPAQLKHVLDVWPVARLATQRTANRPQVVPMVFVLIDGAIYSPIDGKPKKTGNVQRVRNVARNGAVSLLLDHYDADWRSLWWLRIDGAADVVDGDDLPVGELNRIDAALRRKYPQYEYTPVFRDRATLIRIRPESHLAWSARSVDWEALDAPRVSP